MRPLLNPRLALAAVVLAFFGVFSNLLSEETPYGRVKGTILAAETGAALPNVEVALVKNDRDWYRTTTDPRGNFSFGRVETGVYSLTAETKAHEQPKSRIIVQEDRIEEVDVPLKPMAPFVRILQDQQVFTTREEAKFQTLGFVPAKELAFRLYRVKPETAVERWNSWLSEGLNLGDREIEKADLDRIPELESVESRTIPIAGKDIEGVFRQEIRMGRRAPGMYLAALQAGATRGLFLMTVTDLGLVVKASPETALVYAMHLESGAPLPNTSVRLLSGSAQVGQGRTDASGLLSLPIPASNEMDSQVRVVGQSGDSVAVASLYAGGGDRAPLKVYTYTDRPVYRPGHTVHYKSTVRELADDEYRVPGEIAAGVRVVDDKSNLVYNGGAGTNAYGSLSGSFDLNENAIPGTYTLTVLIDGRPYESNFRVAEYRKPEFEVNLRPDRERYVMGETIRATLDAQYYFGAPVANAKVEYYVTRSPSWYAPDAAEWDEDLALEGESYGGGENIAEGQGATDKNGRLQIIVPPFPNPTPSQMSGMEGQDWRVEIQAYVTDASSRSESGSTAALVTQGDYRLDVRAEDLVAKPGQPVRTEIRAVDYDGKPVPNARGEAVLLRVDWLKGQERVTELARQTWRADAQGQGVAALTPPRDGDYRIRVTSTDRRGRVITAQAWVWVVSDEYASFSYPYQDLDVQADKKLYKEGEVAEVIVNTKHAPADALLTLEGATLLQRRPLRLAGKTNVLRIPITPDLMPAARMTISFVKAKQIYMGEAVLNVSRERKAMKVEVAPDRPSYLPGETATYRVRTLSPEGEPVPAEVSLGVVDEAIYAVQRETTTPIVPFFYPKRLYEVQTTFSSPDVYLSGDDKAGDTIQTRRDFKDTAFWAPSTITDDNGEALFQVTMPENLTTWRATVRAATLTTDVGQATAEAITQKPFLLRLEAPRFFTQGDEVSIAAVAHNMTGAPLNATVGMEMSGVAIGGNRQTSIAPGESQRVEWRVRADDVGEVPIRVWGRAGALSDAMELTLPVIARGREQTLLRSGAVDGRETVSLTIPGGVIPETQSLTIRLTPSLASAMLGSLDYLATYPYGCTEQTLSAFLPDLMIVELLDRAGVENPDLRRRLPGMVEAGLLRLYRYQHADGGWGWWEYDETDPWMTSYAVFGLHHAGRLGFEVNPSALSNGVAALKRVDENPKKADPDTQAFMAYVLALAGEADAARRIVSRWTTGNGAAPALSDWGRPMLALALERLGRADDARALLETVWPRFTGGRFDPIELKEKAVWRSDSEYAAVLLTAAVTLNPDDPRLPDLVRGLLDRRRGDHWHSTRDTALALYGMSRYLLASQELQPDMTARVFVNGREAATRRFTAADVFQPEAQITLPAADLKPGPLTLRIETAGAGRLYYSATWTGTVAGDLNRPVSTAGLSIERSYRQVRPGETFQPSPNAPAPAGGGQTEFAPGEIVEVTLVLRTARPLDYLMVEDPIPAGAEVPDRGDVDPWEWRSWWADQVVRDEGVSFAVRHLEPGVKTITYRMFAQVPGRYTALPPRVFDMYNPEVRGEGAATAFTVKP